MAAVHLIEGPVGAGKSTFAQQLARQIGGIHVPLDEWFVCLFSPDRPDSEFVSWYVERKQRLPDLIWRHAQALIRVDARPILELGLIQRQLRQDFYQRAQRAGVVLSVHVLDAPREVRWARVQARNVDRGASFSMVVPESVFEMASDLWEPPDEDEIAEHGIEFINDPTTDE